MKNFHSIVLNVPISCKDEFSQELDTFSWTENEVMIRIGLHGVRILRQGTYHSESSSLKLEYENQLAQKDKEHQLFERVMLDNQSKWVDSQVTQRMYIMNEQLSMYKEENDKCKANILKLETDKHKQNEVYETHVQLEREKIRNRYDEMVARNDELQQQVYAINLRHQEQISHVERQLRVEQETNHQQYQMDILRSKEEIIQLKENIASIEKVKDMERQLALDEYKIHENDARQIEVSEERESQNQQYISVVSEMKILQEKLSKTEHELLKSNALCTNMENMAEMTVQTRINNHIQHENTRLNTLQDELLRTSEELSRIRLTNETSKVEALNSAMEMHKKEFEEIKETLKNSKHSSSGLGKIGETYFHDLAEETFGTYDGFEIHDKTKIAHSGDFHLQFKDFTILVDTKNFIKGRISTTDVNKFKFDMTRNQSLRIGWLVSLQGPISNYGKRPYIFEVVDGRLLVYINDLQNVPDPIKMLQDIWHVCCFLYHQMLNTESNADVLVSYKRYEKRVNDSMEKLQKMTKKTTATMNQLRDDILETEKFIKELINEDVANVRNEHNTTVEEWLNAAVVVCDGGKIKSNILYNNFQEKTQSTTITIDMFKTMLKTILRDDQIQCGKQQKSHYTILGYALK